MEVRLRVTAGPHRDEVYRVLKPGTYTVGRASNVWLALLRDRLLSRAHFAITVSPPTCTLTDPGSRNGTKVNGLRVESVTLRDGDVITAGESTIQVQVREATEAGGPRLCCIGCGQAAPAGRTGPADRLCDVCLARRALFPTTSPDYLIERRLGGGGMGDVYLAQQLATHRPVAIKMMAANRAPDERAHSYFFREMRVLRSLLMPNGQCHPNIVAFYDLLDIGGRLQIVMEYVAGKDAREWVATLPGPLPIAAAARIGKQLLSALEYAHNLGYVHRDVKPSNVLVMGTEQRPRIKLSDFGLAKCVLANSDFTALTDQGEVGGSIGFLSPDHIRDFGDLKAPADVYCAGVTLYYLLTRQFPYFGIGPKTTVGDACTMILENPAVPLRVHRPDAPEGLEAILRKALEKEPGDRWRSAGAMADALRKFVDGNP